LCEAERRAGVAEGGGFVAGVAVGHDSTGLDAEDLVTGDDGLEEGEGAEPVRPDPGGTRLAVAGETPTASAIRLPIQR
jgi:hypothetical protein